MKIILLHVIAFILATNTLSAFGYEAEDFQWTNLDVSASFVPDGTLTDNYTVNNLQSKMNAL